MRKLIPGLAIASTFAAACGSGPRTADAFFVGLDGGPPDAQYSDAFHEPFDAFSGTPRDAGPMLDSPTLDTGRDAPTLDAPLGPDAAVGTDADLMPVANDTCDSAIVVGAGSLSADSTGAVNDYGTGTGCSGTDGPDVVYAIDVPAGAFLSVSVTSGDGVFDPSISLVDATCGGSPRTCLDGDDSGLESTVNTAEYANTTASTARIYAVVDTYDDASLGGAFDLTVSLASPAGNDTCTSATTITPGTYSGTTSGAADDFDSGTGCAGGAGLDVVYALEVGAGQRATVSVTSRSAFDPSIDLLAGPAASCGGAPLACLASDDSSGTDVAEWTNTTGATTTIYAVVDSATAGAAGLFDLEATVETPPAGDVCGTAERIGASTVSASVVGFRNDFGSGTGCSGTSGADRVYVVSVAPGQTLTADVTSADGSFDPSISLQTDCAASPRVCVAGDDTGTSSTVNMVTYTNAGAAAQDVFIVIDTYSSTTTGDFTMHVALAP